MAIELRYRSAISAIATRNGRVHELVDAERVRQVIIGGHFPLIVGETRRRMKEKLANIPQPLVVRDCGELACRRERVEMNKRQLDAHLAGYEKRPRMRDFGDEIEVIDSLLNIYGAAPPTALVAQPRSPDSAVELKNEIIALHPSDDQTVLLDLVVFLVWDKLRQQWHPQAPWDWQQNWAGNASFESEQRWGVPDAFLGVSDLKTHFSARAAAGLYVLPDVVAYVTDHGPPVERGDLRSWLAVTRHVYSDNEINLGLLDNDISDEIAYAPRLIDLPRYQVVKRLKRGLGQLVLQWADLIAKQLMTGSCNCRESCDHSGRAFSPAYERCCGTHFLADANLAKAREDWVTAMKVWEARDMEKEGDKLPPTNFSDPLKFVERAVTGACTVNKEPRGFAYSMFCQQYVTPTDRKIRLGRWHDTWVLTIPGERQSRADEGGSMSEPSDASRLLLCFWCLECAGFLGAQACKNPAHHWSCGMLEESEADTGRYLRVKCNQCQANHFWAAGRGVTRCSWCGQQPISRPKYREVFEPDDPDIADDIPWFPPRDIEDDSVGDDDAI